MGIEEAYAGRRPVEHIPEKDRRTERESPRQFVPESQEVSMGTRKGYDLELKEINDRVETMGKQVLLAIDRTIIALEKMDVVAAN